MAADCSDEGELPKAVGPRGEALACPGDTAVLWGSYSRIFSAVLQTGAITNNRYGSFHHDDLIGKPYGSKVVGRKGGAWMAMLRSSPEMITQSLVHRTQIIYHADISMLLTLLDARPGKVMVEAGTGSGSVSASFARALRPGGRLHTFEFHADRQRQAAADFARLGLDDIITSRHRDVCQEGLPAELGSKAVDGAFFDLPMPWLVVPHLESSLVGGGRVVMFSPCIEQVDRTASELRRRRYMGLRVFETLAVNWGVKAMPSASAVAEAPGKKRRIEAASSSGKAEAADGDEGAPAGDDAEQEAGDEADRAGEGQEPAAAKTWGSYQLPMRSHTGYLLFAMKPPDDEYEEPGS